MIFNGFSNGCDHLQLVRRRQGAIQDSFVGGRWLGSGSEDGLGALHQIGMMIGSVLETKSRLEVGAASTFGTAFAVLETVSASDFCGSWEASCCPLAPFLIPALKGKGSLARKVFPCLSFHRKWANLPLLHQCFPLYLFQLLVDHQRQRFGLLSCCFLNRVVFVLLEYLGLAGLYGGDCVRGVGLGRSWLWISVVGLIKNFG